jgi:hypothetical protein
MLLVKWHGRRQPFHPRLMLKSTGYCPAGHWCGVMFQPGTDVGLKTIHECPTVKEAVEYYLSELKRCRHEPISSTLTKP